MRTSSPQNVTVKLSVVGERGQIAKCVKKSNFDVTQEWSDFRFAVSPELSGSGCLEISTSKADSVLDIGECWITLADDADSIQATRHPRYFVEFQANSHGFRDIERTIDKSPNVVRIAVLGDSMTEGWGVHFDDLLTQRLEKDLNRQSSGTNYEVLNFGISGYGSKQHRILYDKTVKKFSPDIVIVMVCFNDDMSAFEEERLRELLKNDPSQVSDRLKRRIDFDRQTDFDYDVCVRELRELSNLCHRDHAQLAIVFFRQGDSYPWGDCVRAISEGMKGTGAHIWDPGLLIANSDDMFAHRIDKHPSAKAHLAIADFLFRKQKEEGLLIKSPNGTDD